MSAKTFLILNLEKLNLKLNDLTIKLNESNFYSLEWRYKDNEASIDNFLQKFESSILKPQSNNLSLIIEFHSLFRKYNKIESKSVYDFILSSQKPMIQKQYLIMWLKSTFGLNSNEVCISPINPPNCLECQLDSIETRLIALLWLFYDIKPIELSKIQLWSIVFVRPNYWFKSLWK